MAQIVIVYLSAGPLTTGYSLVRGLVIRPNIHLPIRAAGTGAGSIDVVLTALIVSVLLQFRAVILDRHTHTLGPGGTVGGLLHSGQGTRNGAGRIAVGLLVVIGSVALCFWKIFTPVA